MKLTNRQITLSKPAGKPYKLSDGGGLYLQITTTGGRYWRYKFRFGGKEKLLALGVHPDVSLKEARLAHQEARAKLAKNIDPTEQRRTSKQSQFLAAENNFEAIAQEWFDTLIKDKSESYKSRTARLLAKDLVPHIGSRPISEITAPELLSVLRGIENRGARDMAHRARQTARQVFSYAIQTGRAERNPAADLHGALASKKTKHHAAITEPALLGKLLRDMQHSHAGTVVKTALLLSPILFQRPGEIRAMEWLEIHWEEERWEIPAEKMKMRLPHIVPLPRQALDLLKELQKLTGKGKFVFPSARGASRCLSENGVRIALRDLGYDNETITPHGFRATARTLLDEELEFRVDWIEHQLAHAVNDANGRAYNRTSHLKGRAEMMQAWANYLDKLRENATHHFRQISIA